MDEARYEWKLFCQTWKNRIPKRHKDSFSNFDIFIQDLFTRDLSNLEKIIIISRYGKAALCDDKKTLYLYKSPFAVSALGLKKEISISAIFSPILDALVDGLCKKYPKIIVLF